MKCDCFFFDPTARLERKRKLSGAGHGEEKQKMGKMVRKICGGGGCEGGGGHKEVVKDLVTSKR